MSSDEKNDVIVNEEESQEEKAEAVISDDSSEVKDDPEVVVAEEQPEAELPMKEDSVEKPVEAKPEIPKRRKRRKKREKKITIDFEGVPTNKAFLMFDKFPSWKAWWQYWKSRVSVISKKESRILQKKVQRHDDLNEAHLIVLKKLAEYEAVK